jgi:hypothetical protein
MSRIETNGKGLEKTFAQDATEAGFIVKNPRPIRIQKPVKNRNGILSKVVTLPDKLVIDPDTKRYKHVEITSGSPHSCHKKAQRRVVKAAGMEANYAVITEAQEKQIHEAPTSKEKRIIILAIFGWLLTL